MAWRRWVDNPDDEWHCMVQLVYPWCHNLIQPIRAIMRQAKGLTFMAARSQTMMQQPSMDVHDLAFLFTLDEIGLPEKPF